MLSQTGQRDASPRVVHLATTTGGGAGRAMVRLHEALGPAGIDSRVYVVRDDANTPGAIADGRLAPVSITLRKHLQTRPRSMEFFSDDRNPAATDLAGAIPPADIVQLHWVARFVDYRTFFPAITAHRPLVWTLHDMNPFTGGCHYTGGCTRFTRHCGVCPQLLSSSASDLSRSIWSRKEAAYASLAQSGMHVVSPSRWLAAEAQRSTLLGQFDISVIPYGLNTHTFAPLDRASVRQSLGLPQDAALVLFAAAALDNRRKGLDLLTAALGRLATKQTPHRRPVHLLTIGDRPPTMPFPLPHHHLGATNDDRRLAEAYNAADVFVIPSRDDNLPNTVLESLACGTPVVGFAVGGIPDMVRMGETGLLAAPEDTCAMAEAIERVLVDAELRSRLAENARRVAVTEYDAAIQAGRYAALYAQILESSGRDPSRALMGAT